MAGSNSYRRIWEQAALIPEGQVATYGQIAKQAGLPRRVARMVGRAVGAAPGEMNIPWHRIVNAQGRIAIPQGTARYDLQQKLLQQEGIAVKDGQLNIDQYRWDPSLDELLWGPGRLRDPSASDPDTDSEAGAKSTPK
jgi:methylated-DNA-protein-cysteine methyltransferase-like protein